MRPRAFTEKYIKNYAEYQRAAVLAASFVRYILESDDIHADLISARAKSPESLLRKLLEKRYANPQRQVTDLIGVRVIVLYQSDIDPVVKALSERLKIDNSRSVDKRIKLAPTQFGYRSVHLIAKLRSIDASSPKYVDLKGKWYEIQVRSLLEHSWAAIEHECIYKSKIKYPIDTNRRFAAIAASLEVLDREFGALRTAWTALVNGYRDEYEAGQGLNDQLDAARLVALLCNLLPSGHSWLPTNAEQRPLPMRFASYALIALRAVGITRASSLSRAIYHPQTRRVIKRYAQALQQPISKISHLSVVCIVIARRNRSVFYGFFPEFVDDPFLKKALSL